jgi:hypothetical protein
MLRDTRIFRRIVPVLLVAAGVALVGYAVWQGLEPTRSDVQAGEQKRGGLDLDRLKALGARFGQLPGMPIQKVSFEGTAVSDDDVAALDDLPDLDQVDLSKTAVTDRGLAPLRRLPRLELVRLNETKVTDQGLANLENHRALWMLHLRETAVDLTSFDLSTLPALRILDVAGTPVGDAALANLARATTLASLGLRQTKVGDAELARLASLKRLEVLDLGKTAVTDRGVAVLCSLDLPALRAVTLLGCTITTQGLQELSRLRVKRVNLSETKVPFPDTFTILGKSKTLVELAIDNTGVKDGDLKRLATDFPGLTILQARKTALTDAALEQIGKHPSLQMLVLYDTAVTKEGVLRFREAYPQVDVLYGKEPPPQPIGPGQPGKDAPKGPKR